MRRVLVANRGEIAVRVIRACQTLGIETVAVYSDADAGAVHVRMADEAVRLGPTPATQSYLDIERVIAACVESGADAVHPGYGFLSENPAFNRACAAAGVTFIGPTPEAMEALGDKASAKRIADEAGVPTVPSWPADAVPADAYPVLVKASAGGGGRGMRVVRSADELAGALESAGREAAAGFGDDTLLVERLVEGARHVEVQLLGDAHGSVLYVGDRDCSLQRRHQKVVEEAPAPGLGGALRIALGEAAVKVARVAGYTNAGTAEFLVGPDGSFYFLELNARLQVEHPVTELAFGIDLVDWQLRIARGEQLTLTQQEIVANGCAIEARLYAEDPVTLLPTGGRVVDLALPTGTPHVRVDHALEPGLEVSIAYDPLLAKVCGSGATREEARATLVSALRHTSVLGVVTNSALLVHALELPDFVATRHDITTLEANPLDPSVLEAPAELVQLVRARQFRRTSADPFRTIGPWRVDGTASAAEAAEWRAASAQPAPETLRVATSGDRIWFGMDGRAWDIPRSTVARAHGPGQGDGGDASHASLTAPMPGTVIKAVEVGAGVRAGEAVVVLEAMKMENAIAAPFDGVVESVACSVGDLVARGAVVAEVVRETAEVVG